MSGFTGWVRRWQWALCVGGAAGAVVEGNYLAVLWCAVACLAFIERDRALESR